MPEELRRFPFTVEPVASEQVALWASFAAQVTTEPAFGVVTSVFDAFRLQASALDGFRYVASFQHEAPFQRYGVHALDCSVVSALSLAASYWRSASDLLTRFTYQREFASCDPRYQESAVVMEGVLLGQCFRVAQWVGAYCSQVGLPVPERTQAVLAELQPSISLVQPSA